MLPLCVAATLTTIALLEALHPGSWAALPSSAWSLAIGFCLWTVLFGSLPRPVRAYVLAHELTHALWGLFMGARVSQLRVTKKGGSVRLSKSNALITLAPYFFPLYTVCVIAFYGALALFFDVQAYQPFWLAAIGLTWSFHVTFTVVALQQRQPDIEEYGRVLSYSLIYLANVLELNLCMVVVGPPTLELLGAQLTGDVRDVLEWCARGAAVVGSWFSR